MQIRTKIFASVFFTGMLLVLMSAWIFNHTVQNSLESRLYQQFQSIASLQKSRVEGILAHNQERLRLVSSRTQLRLSLSDYLRTGDHLQQQKMIKILRDAQQTLPSFRVISVYDPEGRMVASTGPLEQQAPRYYPAGFLERSARENSAETLVMNTRDELRLLLGGPLVLERRVLGALVIECTAGNMIASVNNFVGLGRTGEILLVRRMPDGRGRVLLPSRFAPEAALSRTLARQYVAPDSTGRLLTMKDYRGRMTLIFTSALQAVDWLMLVKIDQSEVYAPLHQTHRVVVTVTAVLLGAALVFAYFLAGNMTRPITALTSLAERMSRGEYRLVADAASRDEIGVLGGAFNRMAASMLNKKVQLEEKVTQLEQEIAERIKAEEEVATLRGILPLCSFCNRIRDHQGVWQQVDTYLRDHSQADISHSLCPSCMEKHYPEQYAAYLARQRKDSHQ